MKPLPTTLAAIALLATAGGIAIAQPRPGASAGNAPTYDPAQLPALSGKVAQFLPGPMGGIEGLLLEDGTEVHISPMQSTELALIVRPGDKVTIHGLKAKAVPMVMAASITNDATGATLVGRMGRGHHGAGQSAEVEGTIKAALHEPRGEINGVLLDNGAVVRLPPGEARKNAALLAVGQKLYARGMGGTSAIGTVVMARQIGADRTKLTDIAMPRMHDRDHDGMRGGPGMMRHGPMGGQGPAAPSSN